MKSLFTLALVLLTFLNINAQTGWLVGVVDNSLVEVNPQNPSLTLLADINMPPGATIIGFTYSPQDCLFYGIVDSDTRPILVTVDWDGNYTEIGPIILPGETVFFSEGFAYNSIDDKFYATVSLNGGKSTGDNFTETIIEINPVNAMATFVSELAPQTALQRDIDNMVFIDNELIFRDGDIPSNSNTMGFYKLDFQGLGGSANPTEFIFTSFTGAYDLAAIGDQVFMASTDLGFHQVDTESNTLTYIGQTHTASEFNGAPITGLTFAENKPMNLLAVGDTTLCEGEPLNLTIDLENAEVRWNTGLVNNSITIDSAGVYWAEIRLDNCFFTSDTTFVAYEVCDTCQQIGEEIADMLLLGPDVSICAGEVINLDLQLDESFEVSWSNGASGSAVDIDEEGTYWASVTFGDCTFLSDTLVLSIIGENLDLLAVDTTLCEGEPLNLTIDLENAEVRWNTGLVNNSITIDSAGMYWAEVRLDNCSFTSDTAFVAYEVCDTCQQLQEEIADMLLLGPDVSICTGEVINLDLQLDESFEVSWSNGASGSAIEIDQAGTYSATVTFGDCTFLSDTLVVTTRSCSICPYYIPNAFSPQGDGMNDIFTIYFDNENCEISDFEMSIFDRWGDLLLQTNEREWDGFSNGKPADVGVYIYLIQMTINIDGVSTEIIETGDVTIVK